MSDTLSGRTSRKQFALAQEAQARQAALIVEEKANVAAVEAGQRAIRGGGGGLLAFIDKKVTGGDGGLAQLLGGRSMA